MGGRSYRLLATSTVQVPMRIELESIDNRRAGR
jgi:hypothetical protein